MYLIQLLGDMVELFVVGYDNTRAELRQTENRKHGKTFDTEADAVKWAGLYAPGHNYRVVPA